MSFNTTTIESNYQGRVDIDGTPVPDYFEKYDIERRLSFTDECYLQDASKDHRIDRLMIELYFVFCAAVLMFCYRRFSKRVFLFSTVGLLLWSIIFGLIAAMGTGDGMSGFYVILWLVITGTALLLLKQQTSKFFAGILLNWHIYMIPTLVLVIVNIISDQYHNSIYKIDSLKRTDQYLAEHFPIGYWINNHGTEIAWANLLFVFLYVIFCYTRLTKKWHIMPEE